MNTDTFAQINQKLDLLEANPKLKESERHNEYYAHSSVHGGNLLKEHALMVCASVDEASPEYHALVLPLMQRIESFFAHPHVELDFADEVHMLRARRLIEQGKYQQADAVYNEIPYSPMYAKGFGQRNHYFLNATKNHLHLMKKLTHPAHVKHQLISALQALQYVKAYPRLDDIHLYQNAEAIFAQNYYNEAIALVEKICTESLPECLKTMNQHETVMVYNTLLCHKQELPQWRVIVKKLQKHFVELLFKQQQFQRPDENTTAQAHALLDEATSTLDNIQHLVGKTRLEKDFLAALVGNQVAVKHLQQFAR
ncbi:MAG: hypothetical protein WC748_03765 [Legionellales bacterium]